MRKESSFQTIGEEIANGISHGLMALFGLVGLILLLIKSVEPIQYISAVIFGFGMIMLYSMSTIYHCLPNGKGKRVFKRMDHLSIYTLIGGTFAPFLLLLPGLNNGPIFGWAGFPSLGLVLFIVQWTLIAIGITFKSIWINKFGKMHIFIFLLMGWSALTFISILWNDMPGAFYLTLFGGIAYSLGVIFYSLSNYRYFHFIWHIFTALGTILQFLAIILYLYWLYNFKKNLKNVIIDKGKKEGYNYENYSY